MCSATQGQEANEGSESPFEHLRLCLWEAAPLCGLNFFHSGLPAGLSVASKQLAPATAFCRHTSSPRLLRDLQSMHQCRTGSHRLQSISAAERMSSSGNDRTLTLLISNTFWAPCNSPS